jgi:DNA invertase Pin-like site-specific DNA recombinase
VPKAKVALYARYSSDNQRDASIADQLRVCRAYAERQGWTICEEYTDHAVSGATLLRAGFQALMRDALNRRFDVVLAESLDRFSRDQEDTAGLFKRLTFAGVNIVTIAEGDITHLHIGFKGTMNALFLKDLAVKTHRGLRGRIEDGKSAGGPCYGYRVVKTDGRAGNRPETGRGRRAHLPRLRGWRLARSHREGTQPRRHRRSFRRQLESEHDPWERQARNGHPQQRTVRRSAGLESSAIREEPGHREARFEIESGQRVDHEERPDASHHQR